MEGLRLCIVKKSCPLLRECMKDHYSKPGGLVARSIVYSVYFDWTYYGAIVAGSATKHLPGREDMGEVPSLNNIINNTFFHVEKRYGAYPVRNFLPLILAEFRRRSAQDWEEKYGDRVLYFESLVEKPRTGECYLRDGWKIVGETKGFTCKRTGGVGTDSWTGKRVWDTENLRPKLVLVRRNEEHGG